MAPDIEKINRLQQAFESHSNAVMAYALRRSPTREDAEEVVAATFMTAWRRLEAMPNEPDTLRWLYGVARRTLANHGRARLRRGNLFERLKHEPSHGLNHHNEDGRVEVALTHLSSKQREVLRISSLDRLSYAEGAARLRCSPNAYALRLHRARIALRVALENV